MNLKKSSLKFTAILAIAGTTVFFSCSKEKEGISNPFTKHSEEDSKNIKEHLINAYGYAESAIQEYPEFFVVENDIVFEKKNFWTDYALETSVDAAGNKHYRGTYKVNPTGSAYVSIQSAVPSTWKTGVRDAMTAWNGLNGKIKFYEYLYPYPTTGIGLITVKYLDFGSSSTATARAPLPGSGGKPGSYIEINSNPNVSSASKKRTIAHELGHTINFHHTDGTSGTLITTGTSSCNTGTNSTSVMNGTSQVWGGFTTCDKAAYSTLYP